MGGRKDKAEAKNAREEDKKSSAAAAKKKAEEDAAWADEGNKSKAAMKREEEAKKAAEAAARKAENKRLADEEAEAVAKEAKGKAQQKWNYNAGAKKVTAHELYLQKERELKELEKKLEETRMAEKGLVSEEEYARMVEQVNINRRQLEEDARGLDEALKQLGMGAQDDGPATLSFQQFMDREMPRMKEEKPGLKLPQYRDLIWKLYERAIENPRSQARKDWEAGQKRAEGLAQQQAQRAADA